jgi:DNA replication protein DnaC
MTDPVPCATCGADVPVDSDEAAQTLTAAGATLLCATCDQADIDQRAEVVRVADVALNAERTRRIRELMDAAGVPALHCTAVIQPPGTRFTVEPFQDKAYRWASAWARDGGMLTLSGPMGTGKSTIAARAILLVLARGGRGTWRRTSDVVSGLWANDVQVRDAAERLLYRGTGALVLDDLDTTKTTPAALDTLGTLVDRWYADQQPLLVTTNATPEELIKHYGRTGERIASRLLSGEWERVEGRDLRARRDP